MSDVGLPSVGALICPCGLGSTPKFGLGGGGGPTTSSSDNDFLLPFPACTLPRVSPRGWGAGASVPMLIADPTCFPTGNPTFNPSAAPLVPAVACPPGVPAWDPIGTPTAAPPANPWGLAHVGSGRSLARGGRSKLTTGPRPAAWAKARACATGGGFPSLAPLANHAVLALMLVSAARGNWDCCCHGNVHPSRSSTHLSHALRRSTPRACPRGRVPGWM
jgi:hypothetical protein